MTIFVATEPNDGSRWVSEEDYLALKEQADKYMWQARDTCTRAEAAEARVQALSAECGGLREDAERWRALMSVPRIRMYGSAGVNPKTGERWGDERGGIHFGADFWSAMHDAYDPATDSQNNLTWGRGCLIALADDIRARAALQQEPQTIKEGERRG